MALTPRDTSVRIRVCRPSDHLSIQALVKRCFLYGAGSPARNALCDGFSRPSTYVLYVLLALSVFVIIAGRAFHGFYLGAPIASSIIIYLIVLFYGKAGAYIRLTYSGCRGDLTPLGLLEVYGLVPSKEQVGDYMPVGPKCFWVAEVDVPGEDTPRVVGCIGLDNPTLHPDHGEIRRLVVSPDYRCLGIAQKLIMACEDRAKECGLASIVLETTEYHPNARRFYERNGYFESGQSDWQSGLMTIKLLHYQKLLKAAEGLNKA